MMKFMVAMLTWLKSVYSESSGSGSSTRVHIGVILAFIVGLGVSFAVATHTHRITIEQFNNFLQSAGTFFVTTSGPLYAANQAGNWLQKREENKANTPGA